MAWPDEENVLIGQAFRDNNAGRVTHFRSGSSDYTVIRSTAGHAGNNFTKHFGSFLYWHTASNSGIYGAQNGQAPNNIVLNLIPSQSDGYLPLSNPHSSTGHSTIDISTLERSDGNVPQLVAGTSINVDRASGNRIVATTIQKADNVFRDNRVHFSIGSGS